MIIASQGTARLWPLGRQGARRRVQGQARGRGRCPPQPACPEAPGDQETHAALSGRVGAESGTAGHRLAVGGVGWGADRAALCEWSAKLSARVGDTSRHTSPQWWQEKGPQGPVTSELVAAADWTRPGARGGAGCREGARGVVGFPLPLSGPLEVAGVEQRLQSPTQEGAVSQCREATAGLEAACALCLGEGRVDCGPLSARMGGGGPPQTGLAGCVWSPFPSCGSSSEDEAQKAWSLICRRGWRQSSFVPVGLQRRGS